MTIDAFQCCRYVAEVDSCAWKPSTFLTEPDALPGWTGEEQGETLTVHHNPFASMNTEG